MDIIVQNTGRFGYWLTLSDGRSVELSPKAGPVSLPERELEVNGALQKMLAKGLVRRVMSDKTALKKSKTGAKSGTTEKKSGTIAKP